MCATGAAGQATAAPPTDDQPVAVTYGGHTQSTDPSRFDYVPPTSKVAKGSVSTGVQPMAADGYAFLPAFQYTFQGLSIPIPGSYLYHRVEGSGLRVTYEEANWNANGYQVQMCNYQFQFQNRYGSTIYETDYMAFHSGCSWLFSATQSLGATRTESTGQLCARLFVNGSFRGEQCHNIYP